MSRTFDYSKRVEHDEIHSRMPWREFRQLLGSSMTDLPNSWFYVKIVEVLTPNENGNPFQQGWSPQCEKIPAGINDWGVLKTTAIQEGEFLQQENKTLPEGLEPRPHLEIKPGDILMTCAGPRNRCGVTCYVKDTRPKLMMSGKMYRFRTDTRVILSKYLEAFLHSHDAKLKIDKMKTGISDSGLNLTHARFSELQIPLPPYKEQGRIVAKISQLFSELDKGVESLKAAREQLKVYRQAVLKHAFEGKLTAKWREENPDKLESPEQLFARIQQERETSYQQRLQHWKTAIKTWETAGKVGKKPRKPKNQKRIKALDLNGLVELPNGWSWVTLDSLLDVSEKPMTTGPFGTALKKSEHKTTGVPVLGIENIGEGKFKAGNKIYVSEAKARELSSFKVNAGDIIISRSGTVGEICQVPHGLGTALISTNLLRISLNQNIVTSELFVLMFQGGEVKLQVKDLCKGSSREFLNQSILGAIVYPISGRQEQIELAKIIEEKFSVIQQIELEIEQSLNRAETLRQSILKKAFSGQLVAQDPHDEPASVLLERIRAEKVSQNEKQKLSSNVARIQRSEIRGRTTGKSTTSRTKKTAENKRNKQR